jgi:hypothetical protein
MPGNTEMGMAMRIRDLLGEDVWHGSPHHFDRFSTDHMDSGEGSQVPHRLEVGLDQIDRDDRPTVVVRVVQAVGGERRGSDVVVREMVLAQKLVGRRVPHGFDHRVAQPVGPDKERLLRAAVADLVDQQAELGPGPEERLVQIEQVGEVRVLDDLDR